MEDKEKVPQLLTPEEEAEMQEGMALYEMEKNSTGWQVVKKMYEAIAYHSWVDPRECPSKRDWEWRELNAFHASNAANEILDNIAKSISRADYLQKVKLGEVDRRKMKI